MASVAQSFYKDFTTGLGGVGSRLISRLWGGRSGERFEVGDQILHHMLQRGLA
jgi:hypothetical protein